MKKARKAALHGIVQHQYGPKEHVQMGAGGGPHPPSTKGGGSYPDPKYTNPRSEASEHAVREDGKGGLKPFGGAPASTKAKAAKAAFHRASKSKGK